MYIKIFATIVLALTVIACSNNNQFVENNEPSSSQPVVLAGSEGVEIEEVVVTGRIRSDQLSQPFIVSQGYTSFAHDQYEDPAANENYLGVNENGIKQAIVEPVSTFSIDVNTAAYSNIRRMLSGQGVLPPTDAVKLEEMINYFSYNYPTPEGLDKPFSVHTELAPAPWNEQKLLLQIGLKGYEPDLVERPAANLVFLVDVSGSMQSEDKLGLVKKSLGLLVNQMNGQDRIALVAYAGSAGLVLDSTSGADNRTIMRAIDNLQAGGSTHGSAGIYLAYEVAQDNFIEGGINRVLIASDGDMNVGTTSVDGLKELVEEKRKTGIALTTLGFGTGNYNDAVMEQIADVGNGNAAYIDNLLEAQKVLVNEMQSTLLTIAKDVKIQIEFNPALVSEYRLLGYEKRLLAREDFRNDQVDAGEIGAGHTVTALYEITLKGSDAEMIPELRYQQEIMPSSARLDQEMAYLSLRYKLPEQSESIEFGEAVNISSVQSSFEEARLDMQFAASVAAFGQLLRDSQYTQGMSFDQVLDIAKLARGEDVYGYRSEFLSLVELAKSLSPQRVASNL